MTKFVSKRFFLPLLTFIGKGLSSVNLRTKSPRAYYIRAREQLEKGKIVHGSWFMVFGIIGEEFLKRKLLLASLIILIVLLPLVMFVLRGARSTEAAWYNDNWQYRQTVPITNSSGSTQTDFQVAITLNTSALVTAGKMLSTCNDLRVTDINGKILPIWIETGVNACNTTTTAIWTKIPSIPTSTSVLFIYYGNPSASSVQSGDSVFVFFDDFSSPSINDSKWTQGTVAASTGTTFSQSGGNLAGGNNNRYIQSISSYTGDYIAETREYTTTAATNGFSTIGFYASTTNNFGILDHNATSYYRNDSSWVNFTYNGTGQWNRDKVKVVGTGATYWRTGETSGSATNTATNSGISGEYLRLSSRYDDGNYDQSYVATWDWILIRKTAATEPSVASPTNEEKSNGPLGYWKLDEGTGTVAKDSTANNNTGTITGATWQTEDLCMSGKCLNFANTFINTKNINVPNSSSLNQTGDLSVFAWFKANSQPTANSSYKVLLIAEGPSGANLKDQYVAAGYNVVTDTSVTTVSQVAAYSPDIVLCDEYAWGCNITLLNSLYDAGYNVVSKGNDTNYTIYPIATAHSGTHSNTTISPYEKHPLGNGWSSTGNSGGDTGWVIDTVNPVATIIAKNVDGFPEVIYMEESGKGRWFHYQALGQLDATLFTNLNSFILRYNIVGKGKNYNLYAYNGNLYGFVNNQKLSGSISYNTWNHAELVYDKTGGRIYLYLNGNQLTSASYSTTLDTDSLNLIMGSLMKGFIDDPKIYGYARSAAQVKSDYAAGLAHAGSVKGINAALGTNRYNDPALNNGLVGYWEMDEASGNASDSSGNAITLTNNGTTGFLVGKYGNAANIDVNTKYFSTSTAIGGVQTIGFWIKPTANTSSVIDLNGTQTITATSGVISANNFSTPTIYVNGVVSSTLTAGVWQQVVVTTPTYFSTGTMTIGKVGSNTINALLDEVRIYKRALSPNEVVNLYNFEPAPVGYWNFDDASRSTAVNDVSGNGNNGTWTGTGSHWDQGKYGSSGLFAASNYISAGTSSGLDITSNFTISYWAKLGAQNLSNLYMLNKRATGDNYAIIYGFTAGKYEIYADAGYSGANPRTALNTTINDTAWHFISWTYDGTTLRAYLDGVLDVTAVKTFAFANSSSTFRLGTSDTSSNFWNGNLDEVKIYKYARTPNQVIEDMNGGHPLGGSPVGSQIGYWRFDEGYGLTTYDGSPQGMNGTLNNFTSPASATSGWTTNGKFNKALMFDGTNDYVSFATSPAQNPTVALSITSWIKTTGGAGTYRTIISKPVGVTWTSPFAVYNFRLNNANKLEFWINDGSNAANYATSASTIPADSTWHYVAATYDGAVQRIYIDGIQNVQHSLATTINGSTQPLVVGTHNAAANSENWFGSLDEVKMYNSALTADDIKIDYNRGASLVLGAISTDAGGSMPDNSAARGFCPPGDTTSCSPPIALWNFDEGSGTVLNDSSGNSYPANWSGPTPYYTSGKLGKAGNFGGTFAASYATVTGGVSANGSFTIEAWIKPQTFAASTEWPILFRCAWNGSSGTCNYGFALYNNAGTYQFYNHVHENPSPCNNWLGFLGPAWGGTFGAWNHVVMVFSAGTYSFYTNGVFKGSNTITNSLCQTTNNTTIGKGTDAASTNYSFGVGQMDQIMFFNYARSGTQVAWDYNRGGPTAWWRFDEGQGTVANDSSGLGNTGTLSIGSTGSQTAPGNAVTVDTTSAWYNGRVGKSNYSLNFDGTDDRVSLASSTGIPTGNMSYTISAWIKPTAYGSYGIVGWGNWGVANQVNALRLSSTGIYNYWWGNDLQGNINSLTDGNWHHVVALFDGTTRRIYVDTKLLASDTPVSHNATFADFNIGRTNTTEYFPGQIDEVKIFNYGLTQNQVVNEYNQGAVRFAPLTGSP